MHDNLCRAIKRCSSLAKWPIASKWWGWRKISTHWYALSFALALVAYPCLIIYLCYMKNYPKTAPLNCPTKGCSAAFPDPIYTHRYICMHLNVCISDYLVPFNLDWKIANQTKPNQPNQFSLISSKEPITCKNQTKPPIWSGFSILFGLIWDGQMWATGKVDYWTIEQKNQKKKKRKEKANTCTLRGLGKQRLDVPDMKTFCFSFADEIIDTQFTVGGNFEERESVAAGGPNCNAQLRRGRRLSHRLHFHLHRPPLHHLVPSSTLKITFTHMGFDCILFLLPLGGHM